MLPSDRNTSLNVARIFDLCLSDSCSPGTKSGKQCAQVVASAASLRALSSTANFAHVTYSYNPTGSVRLRNTSGRLMQRQKRCSCGYTEAHPLGGGGGACELEMSLPPAADSSCASAADSDRASGPLSSLREQITRNGLRERARHSSNSFNVSSTDASDPIGEVLVRYRSFRSRESLRRTLLLLEARHLKPFFKNFGHMHPISEM